MRNSLLHFSSGNPLAQAKEHPAQTHPAHDAYGLCGKEAGVAHLIIHNAIKHFLFIISREWRLQEKNEAWSAERDVV